MQISDLRQSFSEALAAFAWEQWAQLGVLANATRRDRWAIDPEALILFTLEVGRDEPRLFDELLDWLVVNERLVSVQRLRNLTQDDDDVALVDAALTWVARWRPRPRLVRDTSRTKPQRRQTAQPLFRKATAPIPKPDDIFLHHGLLRGPAEPRRHSRPPDLDAPIAFAFRLRQILGVGARAEVVRVLLTTDAPRLQVQVLAESACYAKRNVQEALSALHAAGVVHAISVANEQRYAAPRERWAHLLATTPDELPTHRDWPQLLLGLRRILRWLHDPVHEQQSDYLRASDARALAEQIAPLLRYAGVPVPENGARGAEYWQDFVQLTRSASAVLAPASARPTG